MAIDVFTDEWCAAWEEKLKESKDFPVYNKGWEGDVGCIIQPDPERGLHDEKYLLLDLYDGTVNGITMVGKEKAESAKFVLTGNYIRWKQVAKTELDPIKAMMQGKLKLKGNLPYMVKYLKGTQEVIRCLTLVDSKFPDD